MSDQPEEEFKHHTVIPEHQREHYEKVYGIKNEHEMNKEQILQEAKRLLEDGFYHRHTGEKFRVRSGQDLCVRTWMPKQDKPYAVILFMHG